MTVRMHALQPLTSVEQAMAEKYFYLVDEFLRRNRLDPSDYYDVVIFGYLKAVQRECRRNWPKGDKNFLGLANICMKCAVFQEWRRLGTHKRNADRLSMSFDSIPVHTDEGEFSLYEVVADTSMDTEGQVIGEDLINRMLAEATPREREAIDYYRLGFEAREIAAFMSISVNTAARTLSNFRAKARAVMEGREVIRCPQWARDKEKIQARNRAYYAAHREEICAKKAQAYRAAHSEESRTRE
ncbi:ECF-type sigma factor [uncultured Dysosmobacter sp.]|uniref:ECF-type sigma factor n=1 Tax=uncultured Dysosmobacter sp. TaxID=2591384 RepID=UPI002626F8D8|nr:ECF-type sigma factor [uncultured Dysosmobacter sp.]